MNPAKKYFDPRFKTYSAEICERNLDKIRTFGFVGVTLGALDSIAELILFNASKFPFAAIGIFIYFAVILLIGELRQNKDCGRSTAAFYLIELPLMILAIMMGTFMDRTTPALTVMVFICVMPLFIMDVPWRIMLYIASVSVVFIICDVIVKPAAVFKSDLVNLLSFALISMGINSFSLFERIDSVEALSGYRKKAELDLMTGVYNRVSGDDRIDRLLAKKAAGVIIILDIDHFKIVNDQCGHDAGDKALIDVASVLKQDFRSTDVIMRLGGDELAVYATGMVDRKQCAKKLDEVREDIAQIQIPGLLLPHLTVSIGCAVNDGSCRDRMEIYKRADSMLYAAKKAGRNRYIIEEPGPQS